MKRNFSFLSSITAFIFMIISFSFSDTCNFPFPQNANYPYGIKPNNFTNAQMDQHCLDWFNKWKAYYVTQNNCTGGEWRVQRTVTGNGITNGCYGFATAPAENDTVSEAIGYGMVIMVFMSSATNNTQQYFNGFYTYYKDHLDGAGLMNWQIPYCNSGGSATDADEDVAFALLAADKQWGSLGAINYKNEATTIIGRILSNEISAANDIRPGDGWDGANISYFAPYEYRMFGDYTSTARWYSVASHTYQTIVNYYYSNSQTLNSSLGMNTGLQPNWCNYDGTTWSPGAWSMDPNSWWWDAIRHVWRQSYDYLLYGTMDSPLAYSNNTRVSTFFQTKYGGDASKILSHYTLDGTETQYNRGDRTPDLGTEDARNLPGPEGAVAISAMVEGDQNWLNECYYNLVTMDAGTGSGGLTNTGVLWGTDYFCDILKMQYLLILTGNMPNPMGNYPTPTPTNTWNVLIPTPTATATPIKGMFDDFETGNIINLDTSAGGQTAFTSVANTTDKPDFGSRSLKIVSTASGWGAYGQDSPYTGGLGYLDETGATALTFYIYPTVALSGNFFVKLVEATANGADGETYSNRITESTNSAPANTWTKITIAITNTSVFSRDEYNTVNGDGVLDLSGIKSFYLQVDSAPNATIYIDNIQFTGNFPTATPTSTVTKTRTPNGTPTSSPTMTVTATNSPNYSPTITPTGSSTQTNTPFISPTITPTPTITATFTLTPYIPFGIFDDFETGVFKNLNTTDTGGGSTTVVTNVTSTVHAGTHSMQVVTTGTGWSVVTIDSPYDGGLGYRDFTGATAFNFWIDAPAGTVLFVKIVETNGQQWSDRNTPITVPAAGWQDINVALSSLTVDQYSPTGDGDSVLDLNIIQSVTFQWDSPGAKTMYIDDIKFTGMPTPTMTPSSTRTATFTRTTTPSFTCTSTPAFTKTFTPSVTQTWSFTVPATSTFTQTATPTETYTYTGTSTFTPTSSPTFTQTYTVTPTKTVSPTITVSPTGTPPTQTITPTVTVSSSTTATGTASFTATYTWTYTNTATMTYTPSNTQTSTATGTFTQTLFITPSSTPTFTLTLTGTPPTATFTSTVTPTYTVSATNTPSITMTLTATPSQSMTITATFTPAQTVSVTFTSTPTYTYTPDTTGPGVVVFPNPFNPVAGPPLGIAFDTGDTYQEVDMRIYTRAYRLVFAGKKSGNFTGKTQVYMDASGLSKFANGVYFYVITGSDNSGQNKKLSTGVIDIIR